MIEHFWINVHQKEVLDMLKASKAVSLPKEIEKIDKTSTGPSCSDQRSRTF